MDEGQTPDRSVLDLNTNLDGAPEDLASVPAGFSVLGTTRQSPQGYRYTGATVVSTNSDPSWQPMRTELPHPGRVVCVAIEDKIYTLWDSGEVWAYDPESPSSSAWSPRANMPGPRRYAFGVGVLDKKIYVVGVLTARVPRPIEWKSMTLKMICGPNAHPCPRPEVIWSWRLSAEGSMR
jgi:hypothetical protein